MTWILPTAAIIPAGAVRIVRLATTDECEHELTEDARAAMRERKRLERARKRDKLTGDRHRPGYWRDYHARNAERRRPYLAAKAREYRAQR